MIFKVTTFAAANFSSFGIRTDSDINRKSKVIAKMATHAPAQNVLHGIGAGKRRRDDDGDEGGEGPPKKTRGRGIRGQLKDRCAHCKKPGHQWLRCAQKCDHCKGKEHSAVFEKGGKGIAQFARKCPVILQEHGQKWYDNFNFQPAAEEVEHLARQEAREETIDALAPVMEDQSRYIAELEETLRVSRAAANARSNAAYLAGRTDEVDDMVRRTEEVYNMWRDEARGRAAQERQPRDDRTCFRCGNTGTS